MSEGIGTKRVSLTLSDALLNQPVGGTQQSFIPGGSAQKSNLLPFAYHFLEKRLPFRIVYLLLTIGTHFIYLV